MPRVTITVPELTPQPYRFQLDREVVQLGRGSDNDIVIDSGSVSTHHAEMRRVYGGYELHDIGSTNGLKSDGVRHPVVPLYHGSTVMLGDVAFDFSLTDEEQEMLVAEAAPQDPGIPLPVPDVPASTQPLGQAVKPRPVPKRQVIRVEQDSGGGFMMTLLLIIFALLAFAAGVMIRHAKETGGNLIDHIQAKREGKPVTLPGAEEATDAEAPAPAPVPPAPPVPVAPPPAPNVPAPTLPPAGDSAPPAPGQ